MLSLPLPSPSLSLPKNKQILIKHFRAIELKEDAARLMTQETVQDKFKIEVTDTNGTAAHSILILKKERENREERRDEGESERKRM